MNILYEMVIAYIAANSQGVAFSGTIGEQLSLKAVQYAFSLLRLAETASHCHQKA